MTENKNGRWVEQKETKKREKNDFHGATSDMCAVFFTRQKIDTIKA